MTNEAKRNEDTVEPMVRTLPLRIGGVMRCCIETLDTTPITSEAEGTILPCKYCSSSLRVREGAWEWNRDSANGSAHGRGTASIGDNDAHNPKR